MDLSQEEATYFYTYITTSLTMTERQCLFHKDVINELQQLINLHEDYMAGLFF